MHWEYYAGLEDYGTNPQRSRREERIRHDGASGRTAILNCKVFTGVRDQAPPETRSTIARLRFIFLAPGIERPLPLAAFLRRKNNFDDPHSSRPVSPSAATIRSISTFHSYSRFRTGLRRTSGQLSRDRDTAAFLSLKLFTALLATGLCRVSFVGELLSGYCSQPILFLLLRTKGF